MNERVDSLLRSLYTTFDETTRKEFVIFGDAALTLHDIRPERHIEILEVFVSEGLFVQFSKRYPTRERLEQRVAPVVIEETSPYRALPFIRIVDEIELFYEHHGYSHKTVSRYASPVDGSYGFRVASLGLLNTWCLSSWNRWDANRLEDWCLTTTELAKRVTETARGRGLELYKDTDDIFNGSVGVKKI